MYNCVGSAGPGACFRFEQFRLCSATVYQAFELGCTSLCEQVPSFCNGLYFALRPYIGSVHWAVQDNLSLTLLRCLSIFTRLYFTL